jgi:hypothetical protein
MGQSRLRFWMTWGSTALPCGKGWSCNGWAILAYSYPCCTGTAALVTGPFSAGPSSFRNKATPENIVGALQPASGHFSRNYPPLNSFLLVRSEVPPKYLEDRDVTQDKGGGLAPLEEDTPHRMIRLKGQLISSNKSRMKQADNLRSTRRPSGGENFV